jgi:hypothetical protein
MSISPTPVRLRSDHDRQELEEADMQYLLMIYGDPEAWENATEEERGEMYARYEAVSATPGILGGAELAPRDTATTVRVRNGETLTTDGPFADMKESIGGYYLFEAESLDDAIALAARIPASDRGAVEVRPIVER